MNWRDYLKPEEEWRLNEIAEDHASLRREHRRIYDRCRKRMAVSKAKEIAHEGE